MATCYYCGGTGRCAGCEARGVQFDGRSCALCGGSGRCQHCTGGRMSRAGPAARRLAGPALAATMLAAGWSGTAGAQSLPPYVPVNQRVCSVFDPQCPGGTGGNFAGSTSSEEQVVFNTPVTRTTSTTIYETQIIGRLNGGTPLYDHTFPVPFSDPIAQSGVSAARAAITTAGGPGVIIGTPLLTASSMTTSTSSTTLYSLANTSTSISAEVTVGPSSSPIQIGVRSSCTGISSLPSTTAPSCGTVAPVAQYTATQPGFNINFRQSGNLAPNGALILDGTNQIVFQDPTAVTLSISGGVILTNLNTTTTYTIDQTTTTTNITTIFEQYTINGIVRRIGSVHALAADAGGDAAGLFTQRLRLAGDGELRRGFWLTGYGFFGERGRQGEIAADRRSGEGVTGGFAARFGDGFSAGAGFDAGRTRLRLPAVGESGTVSLVQAGAHVGFDRGPFSLRLSGAYGWGHVRTLTAPADFDFATQARYGLHTASLSGEAGYAVPLGGWRLTPSVGGEWRRISTDRFAEPGTYGLSAAANHTSQARGWAGLTLDRPVGDGGGIRLYGRATVQGNDQVVLPVGFTLLGGAMRLESPDYGTLGAEAGASAVLPLARGISLYAAYDARLRGNLALHTATGGLAIGF